MALKEFQQRDAAGRVAQAVSQYAPNDLVSRFNLALIKSLHGNFPEGWPGPESR